MEVKEAVEEITSKFKWWATSCDKIDHDWNRITARNILRGTAKKKTIETFLNKFGYEIKTNVIKIK